MKLEISGVTAEQRAAWDSARGHESFASWARRMLDAAARPRLVMSDVSLKVTALEGVGGPSEPGLPASSSVEPELTKEELRRRALTERGHRGVEVGAAPADLPVADGAGMPESVAASSSSRSVSARDRLGTVREGAGLLPKRKRKAGGMCEHRVPAGQFCKRCDG